MKIGGGGMVGLILQPAGGGPYAGPGDIVSGALAWWGLRAYTLSSIGTNLVLLAAADLATQAFASVAGGGLDVAGITSFLTTHGSPGTVQTLYNQGSGGSAYDLPQLTNANQPKFVLTGNGLTVPNMGFVAASNLNLSLVLGSITNQPLTMSVVFKHTASVGQQVLFFSNGAGGIGFSQRNSADNQFSGYAGVANFTVAASDGIWNFGQAVFTGSTNDIIAVNASQTGGSGTGTNMGTDPLQSAGILSIGVNAPNSQPYDGFVAEAGIWTVAFSGAQLTSMYNNQHTYYGI